MFGGEIVKLKYSLLVLKLLKIKAGRGRRQKYPHSRLSGFLPSHHMPQSLSLCSPVWAQSLCTEGMSSISTIPQKESSCCLFLASLKNIPTYK